MKPGDFEKEKAWFCNSTCLRTALVAYGEKNYFIFKICTIVYKSLNADGRIGIEDSKPCTPLQESYGQV